MVFPSIYKLTRSGAWLIACFVAAVLVLPLASCSSNEHKIEAKVDKLPPIFPDFTDVTVPPNLVAPRFWIADSTGAKKVQAVFTVGDKKLVVDGDDRMIYVQQNDWNRLIDGASAVSVRVLALIHDKWTSFKPFTINIAKEPIDPFIAYRLIEPGYESWNEMGIYQRSLESFRENPIINNNQTNFGCMNCHSFCNYSPDTLLMHMRVECGGTYIIEDDNITKLNTKTPETISPLVYPYWHPTGRYVAFSVNDTKQMFHTTDPNRIEVYDNASDVVVYDVDKKEIVTSPLLKSETSFETFPTFSPDGRTLYFCTADSAAMPDGYDRLRYNICSISFDPDKRSFGAKVDTLYNAVADDHSASFPRVSPDGRTLVFTRSKYGTFSIWHRDADLYSIDLATKQVTPLTALNSNEAESYHSFSSNGRWMIFSSRRLDGLYTRPFIAYIDTQGRPHKPFVLPPKNEDTYHKRMKSFNIPEFIKGNVTVHGHDISDVAQTDPGIDVKYCPAK